MYCRQCAYPLDGLSEPLCPECGRGFDAGDRRTYNVASKSLADDLMSGAFGLLLAVAGLAVTVLTVLCHFSEAVSAASFRNFPLHRLLGEAGTLIALFGIVMCLMAPIFVERNWSEQMFNIVRLIAAAAIAVLLTYIGLLVLVRAGSV